MATGCISHRSTETFLLFSIAFLLQSSPFSLSLSSLSLSLSLSLTRAADNRMGSGSFFKVLLKNFDVLAGPFVTLVYPLYASVKAIESKSPIDDQQWLTYWVLYSLITLFELTFVKVLEWLPIWPYAKLIFNCWLVLPYFSGAAFVYERYVRPLLVNQQIVNIWYVPRKNDSFNRVDDILSAAERYIEANGPEEFEKLINKAERASKSRGNIHTVFKDSPDRESKFSRSSTHPLYDDDYPY